MTTDADYEQKIRSYDWSALRRLWHEIVERSTADWAPGKAFEYLVVRMFELDGADVKYPYKVTQRTMEDKQELIEQIDGIVYMESLSCVVESKDTDGTVNVEPIYKLRNQLLRRPSGVIGSLFSRSGFTDPAITLASFTMPQAILLWEGDEVEEILRKEYICSFMVTKLRRCIETGSPKYDIRTDLL